MKHSPLTFTFGEHSRGPLEAGVDRPMTSSELSRARDILFRSLQRHPSRLFSFEGNQLTTNSYCGVFADRGVVVQVLPKILGKDGASDGRILRNLSHMLERTRLDREIPLTFNSLSECDDNFLETFAFHYSRTLLRALRVMPFRCYREASENLRSKRGRIQIVETIKMFQRAKPALSCRFDVYDEQNIVNDVFSRINDILTKHCTRAETLSNLRACNRHLGRRANVHIDLNRLQTVALGRQWSMYEAPWKLGLMLLRKQSGLMGSSGEVPVSIEFDMNRVFEAYVGELVKDIYEQNPEVRVTTQRPVYLASTVATDHSRSQVSPYGLIDIDVEHKSGPSFIFDAKYKICSIGESVSTSDIFQVLTYAQYRSLELGSKCFPILIFPKSGAQSPEAWMSNTTMTGWLVGFIELGCDLRVDEKRARDSLTTAIQHAELHLSCLHPKESNRQTDHSTPRHAHQLMG